MAEVIREYGGVRVGHGIDRARLYFGAAALHSGFMLPTPLMLSRHRTRAGALLLALATAIGGTATQQPQLDENAGYGITLHGSQADAGGPALASIGLQGLAVGGLGEGGSPLALGAFETRQNPPSSALAPTAARARASAALLGFDAQAQLQRRERAGLTANPSIPPPVPTC